MKVNFKQVLKNLDGTNMKEEFGEVKDKETLFPCKCGESFKVILKERDKRDVILGNLCVQVLLAGFEDEKNLSGDVKMKRFTLAANISYATDHDEELEISPEEATELRKLIGKAGSITTVGRAYPMLEGK